MVTQMHYNTRMEEGAQDIIKKIILMWFNVKEAVAKYYKDTCILSCYQT